ncbi:YchJ family protein [Echinicola sediminis]
MRSRFTAYCLIDAAYLYQSTFPPNRPHTNVEDIKEWATTNRWTKLEILSTQNGLKTDAEGTVEFKAYFLDHNRKEQVHHEISRFVKQEGHWYYVSGTYPAAGPVTSPKINRNAPCPCGSGKKYKKCCA